MSLNVTRTVINAGSSGARGAPGLDGDDGLLSAASSAETLVGLQPGNGDDEKAVTPLALGSFAESIGVMMNRLHMLRPTKAKPFAAMRISKDRWWVSTFVVGGNRMDYSIHEFVNHGPLQVPALEWCWRYNGVVVAFIDGLHEDMANFTGEHVGGGVLDSLVPPIWEPGVRLGPVGGADSLYDYIAPGHGHLPTSGNGIFLNLVTPTPNYRDAANAPIGIVLRGTDFRFTQTYPGATLKDNVTLAGDWNQVHIMVTGGVQIASTFTVTGDDIAITTAMGMGMSGRGNMLKMGGLATAIAADAEDGQDYGISGGAKTAGANIGEYTVFQLYNGDRPTHFLRATLNGGAPIRVNVGSGGVYSWAGNLANRDSWLQDRADGYAKLYATGINRSTGDGPLAVPAGTTMDFSVNYQVCKGALA